MMDIAAEIKSFSPGCEQEERDKAQMLGWLHAAPDPFSRENTFAHLRLPLGWSARTGSRCC